MTGTNITGTAAGLTAGAATTATTASAVTGLSVAGGKTLTASNTLTLTATDGSTLAIGTGGTLGTAAYTAATAYKSSTPVAGDVLQVVYATDAGSNTSAATLTNITGSAKSITPKSSNSTLIVECTFNATVAAGGAGVNTTGIFQLYNNTAGADIGQSFALGVVSGAGANLQSQGAGSIAALVTNTGLTAIAFLLRAKYGSGACTVTGATHVWKITEVQN